MEDELFTAEREDGEAETVLRLSGELDASTTPLLRAALAGIADGGAPVVVDVSALEFVDSTGLGALVAAMNDLTARGRRMVIRKPRRNVLKVLELTSLTSLFVIEP